MDQEVICGYQKIIVEASAITCTMRANDTKSFTFLTNYYHM